MSYVTRLQVAEALYNLLLTANFTTSNGMKGFQTSGRRFRTYDQLIGCQKPAFFLNEYKESHQRGDLQTPVVRAIMFDMIIFINIGQNPNAIPVDDLDLILDAIDPACGGVLQPNLLTNRQTLGGLVWDCYIEGEIDKVPGDQDGMGVAMVPIKVVIP